MTDPIADMLVRIKNAQKVKLSEVLVSSSKMKLSLAKLLEREGYISSVVETKKFPKEIFLKLKYDNKGRAVINGIKKVSKPGQKIYSSKDKLPKILNGLGIVVVSTSSGLMTDREARRKNLGGEIICYIY